MKTPLFFLRGLARLWSLGSVSLMMVFLFGQGVPPLSLQSILFPFGLVLGLILAWKFERVGGLLAVGSVLLFYGLEYAAHSRFPKGPWFFLLAAPGALFLLSGLLHRKR